VRCVGVAAVDRDLDPVSPVLFHDVVLDDVPVAWNEVPGRAVAGVELRLKQLVEVLVTNLRLDVVCQHEGPGTLAGPQGDERHGAVGYTGYEAEQEVVEVVKPGFDRPPGKGGSRLHPTERTPHLHLEAAGQKRSRAVVASAGKGRDSAGHCGANKGQVPLGPEVGDQLVRVKREHRASVVLLPDRSNPHSAIVVNL